jgi:hypothetical protein
LDLLDCQCPTTEFGLAKEKEKALLSIFMSSCPEKSFLGQKKRKIH